MARPGSSGRVFFPRPEESPQRRAAALAGWSRRRVVSEGEEVPGHRGLRHSGTGTAGWAGGGGGDPGAGRWAALAAAGPAARGAALEAAPSAPGRRRGGGLRGRGVSCVPARSPRRGLGGRRRRGRGRSAGATSHEQRPRG